MTCCICLDDAMTQHHQLQCGHTFHISCLMRWVRHRGGNKSECHLTCPLCRRGQTDEILDLALSGDAEWEPSSVMSESTTAVPVRSTWHRLSGRLARRR